MVQSRAAHTLVEVLGLLLVANVTKVNNLCRNPSVSHTFGCLGRLDQDMMLLDRGDSRVF